MSKISLSLHRDTLPEKVFNSNTSIISRWNSGDKYNSHTNRKYINTNVIINQINIQSQKFSKTCFNIVCHTMCDQLTLPADFSTSNNNIKVLNTCLTAKMNETYRPYTHCLFLCWLLMTGSTKLFAYFMYQEHLKQQQIRVQQIIMYLSVCLFLIAYFQPFIVRTYERMSIISLDLFTTVFEYFFKANKWWLLVCGVYIRLIDYTKKIWFGGLKM